MPNRNRHRHHQVIGQGPGSRNQPVVAVQVNPSQDWMTARDSGVVISVEMPTPVAAPVDNGQINRLKDQVSQLKKSNKDQKKELKEVRKEGVDKVADLLRETMEKKIVIEDQQETIRTVRKVLDDNTKAALRLADGLKHRDNRELFIQKQIDTYDTQCFQQLFNEKKSPHEVEITLDRLTKSEGPLCRMTAMNWTQMGQSDKKIVSDKWFWDERTLLEVYGKGKSGMNFDAPGEGIKVTESLPPAWDTFFPENWKPDWKFLKIEMADHDPAVWKEHGKSDKMDAYDQMFKDFKVATNQDGWTPLIDTPTYFNIVEITWNAYKVLKKIHDKDGHLNSPLVEKIWQQTEEKVEGQLYKVVATEFKLRAMLMIHGEDKISFDKWMMKFCEVPKGTDKRYIDGPNRKELREQPPLSQ